MKLSRHEGVTVLGIRRRPETISQSATFHRQGAAGMEVMLAFCAVWNLFDLVATIFEVHTGLAVEANPLMHAVLAASPLLFAVVKLAVVSVGLGFLWHCRRSPFATLGSVGVFGVYSFIVAYHCFHLSQIAHQG